ncbi:AAR2 splicing factor family protein [Sporobolomyces salmoneus]|uniref:AAR2 splicing factor family protein n=1 Tax=Sporobolomyces salmoneus TaxID=183962 RepID=UPI00317CC1BB
MDPQSLARASFTELGFLILSDLPKGSEFGLDGQFWTTNEFNGVKLIPSGLHLFVFSAAPSSLNNNSSEANSNEKDSTSEAAGGLGVRHALFKVYKEGEIVLESWDPSNESLQTVSSISSSSSPTSSSTSIQKPSRRRRRLVESSATAKGTEESTPLISREYLQTLDPSLAPYPSPDSPHYKTWKGLSRYVTEKTVARVVGIDERGIGRVDALVEGWRERDELVEARERQQATTGNETEDEDEGKGKTFWGKKRPMEEARANELKDEENDEEEDSEDREGLEFAKFDEKRSWPKGAVGEELSRWSKDKSWLLTRIVEDQFEGDARELLAELELSFILFTLVFNFSALTSYKSLFSLLCRSSLLTHPSTSRPSLSSSTDLLPSSTTLPLFASFLQVLHSQFSFLDPSFFSTQLPSLESHLLSSLSSLRSSLSDAAPEWYALPNDSPAREIWDTLVGRWNELAAMSMERFGWELGLIEGTKAKYTELTRKEEEGDGEGEVPFEELEEGEDAPVIVDLDGEDGTILVGFD